MTNSIKEFFLFSSGATRSILEKDGCEIEQVKYAAIGATIFFTATLASLSGAYAIFTALQQTKLSIAFGVLWGVIIFNLDRFIVSSIKKQRIPANLPARARRAAKRQEFLKASPRLLLAVFISIVITRPIELRLFRSEITDQVIATATLERTERDKDLAQEYADIKTTEEQTETLRKRIIELENEVSRRTIVAEGELAGWDGSKRAGPGTIYGQRMAEVKKAEADLKAFREQYAPIIQANQDNVKQRKQERDQRAQRAKDAVDNPGLLKKLEALMAISLKSTSALLTSIFIMLLFISVETAPILVKLFSSRGPYDEYFDRIEHKVYATEQQRISDINDEINTNVALSKQRNAERLSAQSRLDHETMASLETLVSQEVQEAKTEVGKWTVSRWKDSHLGNSHTASISANGAPVTNPISGNGNSAPASPATPAQPPPQTTAHPASQGGAPVTQSSTIQSNP